MKIAVLTNSDSLYGRKILLALQRARIPVTVIVVHQPVSYSISLFFSVAKRVGLFDAIRQSIRRKIVNWTQVRNFIRENPGVAPSFDALAVDAINVSSANSAQTVAALEQMGCDLLLLGQCGILKSEILHVPSKGVLNAHPGFLPAFRGLDSSKWAILENRWDQIGVTVHWVDEGVDTGSIIARRRHLLSGTVNSERLGELLLEQCVNLLVEIVGEIIRNPKNVKTLTVREEGVQYYKMHSSLIRLVDRILAGRKFTDKR